MDWKIRQTVCNLTQPSRETPLKNWPRSSRMGHLQSSPLRLQLGGSSMRVLGLRVIRVTLCIWLGVICATSQTTTGSIVGTVVDVSSAAVPNAAVTITNVDTGITTK